MDFSIVPASKVFKTYQGQARIADLNKKNPVKRVQGQKDQVTISRAARQALWKSLLEEAPAAQESSVTETSKPGPTPTEDFVPGI